MVRARVSRPFPAAVGVLLVLGGAAAAAQPARAPGPPLAALAAVAPEGFTAAGPPLLFGTSEHPLADGDIFTYIDGGGLAYLEHGFTDLFHAEYSDGRGSTIALDVYGMASPDQARQALADERICPAGGARLGLDPSARAYRFPPDYFLYFAQAHRLVYVHSNDDRLADRVVRFAAAVKAALEKEGP
jgi:hypothetical protein